MTDLIQAFGNGEGIDFPEFRPKAGYFVAMDCLLYLNEDVSYRAVRLSPWVTVLLHPTDDRAVGVKIKGFRDLIEQVRATLRSEKNTDFTDDEVVMLLTILETAFTASLGEQAISEVEAERRQRWEPDVRRLAKEAQPLSLEEMCTSLAAA